MNSDVAAYLVNASPDSVESELDDAAPFRGSRYTQESPALIITISNAPKDWSDEELMFEVGNGSREALSILFKRHAQPVFNVAKRILRDDSEAEDLLQEVFLFFFHKAHLFDAGKGSASSWIIQMTYHRAIDRRRYLTARQHYNAEELDEEKHHSPKGKEFINEVEARMLLSKLRADLSPEQLQTLELHFFEGYTFHEIAHTTRQTLGNVRHHYYRGLERLRSYVFSEKNG